jgi:hypothetical protein
MTNLYFQEPSFEFETRGVLGNAHFGCADLGEALTAVHAIEDGNDRSWVTAWQTLADRICAIADGTLAAGHRVSARGAYLRAATYYAAAMVGVDALDDADIVLEVLFSAHRRCFDAHVSLLTIPGETVAIPYEATTLPGYFFAASTDGAPRPTIILVNGSDGPISSLFAQMALPGLDRGYNALVFDGPGQQTMLFDRGVPFRPDWEHVITPVVDHLLARGDVDPDRVAIYGISQGGYWVLVRSPSSIAWRPPLSIPASSTCRRRGGPTSRPRSSTCSTPATRRTSTSTWPSAWPRTRSCVRPWSGGPSPMAIRAATTP